MIIKIEGHEPIDIFEEGTFIEKVIFILFMLTGVFMFVVGFICLIKGF